MLSKHILSLRVVCGLIIYRFFEGSVEVRTWLIALWMQTKWRLNPTLSYSESLLNQDKTCVKVVSLFNLDHCFYFYRWRCTFVLVYWRRKSSLNTMPSTFLSTHTSHHPSDAMLTSSCTGCWHLHWVCAFFAFFFIYLTKDSLTHKTGL